MERMHNLLALHSLLSMVCVCLFFFFLQFLVGLSFSPANLYNIHYVHIKYKYNNLDIFFRHFFHYTLCKSIKIHKKYKKSITNNNKCLRKESFSEVCVAYKYTYVV